MADVDVYDYISKHCGHINENVDKIFDEYDKDGNGFIDEGELDDFLKAIYKKEPSDEELEDFKAGLLTKLDANKDGKISKEELSKALPTQENFLLQFRNKEKFCQVDFIKLWKNYDKDGSGYLEPAELELFLKDLIASTKRKVDVRILHTCLLRGKDKVDKKTIMSLLGICAACEAAFQAEAQNWTKGAFDDKFDKYDKDRNGYIENKELEDLFRDLLNLEDKDITNADIKDYVETVVMPDLDKKKDNKIEKDELKSYLKID